MNNSAVIFFGNGAHYTLIFNTGSDLCSEVYFSMYEYIC